MPRSFSEEEKERIKNLLYEKGRELFSIYGLKKTGVAELAAAAGIAQGSFYIFFDSKEELYFRVMEIEEERIQAKFKAKLLDGKKMNRQKFKEFLQEALQVFQENPLIRQLWTDRELETLLKRLPRKMLDRHTSRDTDTLVPLIKHWQSEGSMVKESPEVLVGVIRALFFIPLHQDEIGAEIYPRVADLYIEMIARGLVREESN